ncbi:MAG: T9SS type A sorting domain-containing protein [Bacteroidota bacterium]
MNLLKAITIFLLPFSLSAQNYYGGIPALFDDFSYKSTRFPIEGDSSNSLYGKNIWLTENDKLSSRAWHRYNWGDPDWFGKNSGVDIIPEGISLFALKGFNIRNIPPIFVSGFIFRQGTFVSRIRCSDLSALTNSIQAFWLFSVDDYMFKMPDGDTIIYMQEVDYEYNNWFAGRGEKRVHAGVISAHYRKNGKIYKNISKNFEMRFFQKNDEGKFTDLGTDVGNNPLLHFKDRWFYYLIRLDSTTRTIDFAMQSADETGGNDVVYGGIGLNKDGSIAPITMHENFPRVPVRTIYNLGIGTLDPKDTILQSDMTMDADWLYITPKINVEIDDVVKEVSNFRSRNIPRLNTTGVQMYHDVVDKIHTAAIDGPDTVSPIQPATWTIRPSFKNTSFDIEYSYRRYTASETEPWNFLSSPDATVYARGSDSLIEFKAIVKNYWSKEVVTTTKLVRVIPFKTTVLTEIFPNPTAGLAVIALPTEFDKKLLEVEIFNLLGNSVKKYSTTESKYLTIDLNGNPAGEYFLKVKSDQNISTTQIILIQ